MVESSETRNVGELWGEACKILRGVLSKSVFERWIAVIRPVSVSEKTLNLSVDNDFYQGWLKDNYLESIEKAVVSICGDNLDIKFSVDSQQPQAKTYEQPMQEAAKQPPYKHRAVRQHPDRPNLNKNFTFENFVVGPCNNFAHAASLAASENPGTAYNPLLVYGGVGLGKTHLMQAIGNRVLNSRDNAKVCYLPSEAFLNEYIEALKNNSLPYFRKKHRGTDVLLIDDIQFLAGKERIQEEFFHTFNALFDARKQIVLTSDKPPSEISGLEERLVSRFEWGLVTELEAPDYETKAAIIRKKAEQEGYRASKSAIDYIARNVSLKSGIRGLEGALIKVAAYTSLTGKSLETEEELKNLLKCSINSEALTPGQILDAVGKYYHVSSELLKGTARPASISIPRQVAMYLCRRITDYPLNTIAREFGKTHSSVIHGYRNVEERLKSDNSLSRDVNALIDALGKPLS